MLYSLKSFSTVSSILYPTSIKEYFLNKFKNFKIESIVSNQLVGIGFNEIINIGSNKKSKVKDVIKLIVKITKSKSKIKMYKLNRIKNSKFKDVINRQPDINKIKKLYNWKPSTNLLQGLKKTIFYLDNN